MQDVLLKVIAPIFIGIVLKLFEKWLDSHDDD